MESTEKTDTEKLKPPYGQPSWYEAFFDLNQRQKIEKVDLDFIRLKLSLQGMNTKFLVVFIFWD